MCLAQGQQHSDAGEAQTHGPSVWSLALYHWATALPIFTQKNTILFEKYNLTPLDMYNGLSQANRRIPLYTKG